MSSLEITRTTTAEVGELVDLFAGYLKFYGRSHAPQDVERFLSARLTRGESVVLLARVEGRAVGFVQCYPTWSSLSLAPAWVLNDLFVAEDGRGSGAGRALVRAASDAARDAGAAYIALETAPENATARALYESEGFGLDDEFLHYSLGLADA